MLLQLELYQEQLGSPEDSTTLIQTQWRFCAFVQMRVGGILETFSPFI